FVPRNPLAQADNDMALYANADGPMYPLYSMSNSRHGVLKHPPPGAMTARSRARGARLVDGRVHQIAHQRAGVLALAGGLRHEHGKQVLDGIDPEERSAHAAPEKLADRAQKRRYAGLRAHRQAEAAAVAGGHQSASDLDVGSEVTGRHQLQRLAADDPHSVERTAVEQHLAEPRIVHGGGDQSATAGF